MKNNLSVDEPIGFIPNFSYNENFKTDGLICPYEHCIELMPLEETTEKSCPIWGHDCPGGKGQIDACGPDVQTMEALLMLSLKKPSQCGC